MAAPPTRTPRVGNSSRRHGIHGFLLVTTSDSGRAGGGDLPRRTALVPTPTRETVPVVHPFLVALRQQSRDVPSLGFAGALSRAKKRETPGSRLFALTKRDARRGGALSGAPDRSDSRRRPCAKTDITGHGGRPPTTNRKTKERGGEGRGERGERTSAISSHAAVAVAYMLRRSAAVSGKGVYFYSCIDSLSVFKL